MGGTTDLGTIDVERSSYRDLWEPGVRTSRATRPLTLRTPHRIRMATIGEITRGAVLSAASKG